jgi:hypothetical protein
MDLIQFFGCKTEETGAGTIKIIMTGSILR